MTDKTDKKDEMTKDLNEETVEKTKENNAETTKSEAKKSKGKKETEALKKEIQVLQEASKELNEKYLRMMAEYENYRKRAAKEREGVYTEAYADAISEILPVIDNLERATAFGESDKLAEGVVMTLNMFKQTLEKMGITEIAEENVPFDPNFHNAVMHIEDDSLPENTVVQVFNKGYKKDGKIIRYAMVKVAN